MTDSDCSVLVSSYVDERPRYGGNTSSSSDSHGCDGWDTPGAKENENDELSEEDIEGEVNKENWFGKAHRESALKHSRDFATRRAAKKLKEQKVADVQLSMIVARKRRKKPLNKRSQSGKANTKETVTKPMT